MVKKHSPYEIRQRIEGRRIKHQEKRKRQEHEQAAVIIERIIRRVPAIIRDKYEGWLQAEVNESAWIQLREGGALRPRECPRSQAQWLIARALALAVERGVVCKTEDGFGHTVYYLIEAVQVSVQQEVPTSCAAAIDDEYYLEHYGDISAFPSKLGVQLKRWNAA